jgi:hypothetical protein
MTGQDRKSNNAEEASRSTRGHAPRQIQRINPPNTVTCEVMKRRRHPVNADRTDALTQLHIDTDYYNALYIRSFALMLKDPSYCYKFYWLEAIVDLIS